MRRAVFSTWLAVAGLASLCQADVSMPAIFGDHMVLQQGITLPVWGKASAGERVTVRFGGKTGSAVAGGDGAWRVELPAVVASSEGRELAVEGSNHLLFKDVVVGDVWLASGQSNMEVGIQTADGSADAIAKGNDPQLRLFAVPTATSLTPAFDIAKPTRPLDGKWMVCTPEVLGGSMAWHGMSATAYYFARDLRPRLNYPIGLIASYKGSTSGQAWMSLEGLKATPSLSGYVSGRQKIVDGYDKAAAEFPAKNAAFQAAMKKWNEENGAAMAEAMNKWNAAAAAAKAAGQQPPPQPQPPKPKPQQPNAPDGGNATPGNLYNAMIAPLVPYGIKGVIWYQGEGNADNLSDAVQYRELFPGLIKDWRQKWGEGDLPFLFVQLAGYTMNKNPLAGNWPWARESQAKALSLPNTAMATAIDIGDPTYIHPADKLDVGLRLSAAARELVYGDASVVASGPTFDSMKIEGNTARITFKNVGSGLTMDVPPWTYNDKTPPAPTRLTGFIIAGADGNFVPADAAIDGESVVVSSSAVKSPAAVRYAWTDMPDGNLYNREKLPAPPFRTDDWEPAPLQNQAVMPQPRAGMFEQKIKDNNAKSKAQKPELVFDGDSITDWFQTNGKDVWAKYYAPRRAFDFAVAGDQTGHVLWRLEHGQLDGLDPKLAVILIGTNNTIRDGSDQIITGIRAVVQKYLDHSPRTHVLLLAVFPRRGPDDPLRAKVNLVNAKLAKIDFGNRVTYLDIGKIFLDDQNQIRADLMPDSLHPNAAGYQLWAKAIAPVVDRYCPPASVGAGR